MSKKPIILGIVIIIIGFLLGAIIVNFFVDSRMGDPRHNFGKHFKGNFKKRVIRVIDPDEEQLKEIEPIIDKYTERTSEITEKYYEDFSAAMDSMHNELEPILTEDQKERLSKRREKMKLMDFKNKFKRKKNKWKNDRKGYGTEYGKDYGKGRGNRKGKGYGYEYGKNYGRDSVERKWKWRKDSL